MMKKYILSVVLNFSVAFFAVAQNVEEANRKFDSIYFQAATNLSGQDIDLAFLVADSLYRTSGSARHKVQSLMLTSTLYKQKGELEQAIIQASKAEKIADRNKLYEWQARILGFLSTQYRNMGLYERGKTYLDKGLSASQYIKDQTQKDLYMGMVYQELTYYHLVKQEYDQASQTVRQADTYFQKLPDDSQKTYFIATNKLLWGRVYLKQEHYDLSLEYNQKALVQLADMTEENAIANGFIYNGIGSAYLAKENYPQAKQYLDRANLVANSSESAILQLEVYNALSDYYKTTNDQENHLLYQQKYLETQKLYEINQKKSIDNIINGLHLSNKDLLHNSSLLKIALVILLILSTGFIFFYRQKKKRDIQKFKKVIARLTEDNQKKLSVKTEAILTTDLKENNTPKKAVNISEKKEKEIIEGLKEFEQNKGFLERNISLSTLAGNLNTNTIYLSHILNNGYNKDFNMYINELRIYYIVQKLKEDKDYRRYKISYLAEECGFSSHSKFSSIFKLVTHLSPSTFIERLNKETITNDIIKAHH